jgi:hypothetical protein
MLIIPPGTGVKPYVLTLQTPEQMISLATITTVSSGFLAGQA